MQPHSRDSVPACDGSGRKARPQMTTQTVAWPRPRLLPKRSQGPGPDYFPNGRKAYVQITSQTVARPMSRLLPKRSQGPQPHNKNPGRCDCDEGPCVLLGLRCTGSRRDVHQLPQLCAHIVPHVRLVSVCVCLCELPGRMSSGAWSPAARRRKHDAPACAVRPARVWSRMRMMRTRRYPTMH